jgi:hypothetical protein
MELFRPEWISFRARYGMRSGEGIAVVRHGASVRHQGIIAALLSVVLVLSIAIDAGAQAGPSLEYAVKATYLYKFAPFVEWPASAFASPDSPIVICVSGKDPFGQELDRAISGQRIGTRSIVVRHVVKIDPDSGCQLLYAGGSSDQSAADTLDAVRGQAVLTVSDAATDPKDRGIINFVIDNGKVRFEIDERAAAQNHLAISSKLLSLALQPEKQR